MPPPVSDSVRAEAIRRLRAGEPYSAICAATGVSKGWVSTLCRQEGIPSRGQGTRTDRGVVRSSPSPAAPQADAPADGQRLVRLPRRAPRAPESASPAEPNDGDEQAEPAGYDPDAVLELPEGQQDVAALRALEAQAARLIRDPSISSDPRLFAVLATKIEQLRISMHRLREPPRPDPDLDPANVTARAAVLERVRGMVLAARERAAVAGVAG